MNLRTRLVAVKLAVGFTVLFGAPPTQAGPTAKVVRNLKQPSCSVPTVADLNGDGQPEVVVTSVSPDYSSSGKIHVVDANGRYLPGWPIRLLQRPLNNSPALGDVNGDGLQEVIVESFGHGGQDFGLQTVFAFSVDGTPLTGFPVDLGGGGAFSNGPMSSPSVADIDRDGRADILALGLGFPFGPARVVRVDDLGSIVFDRNLPTSPLEPGDLEYLYDAVPMVGDFGGGSSAEIAVGLHVSSGACRAATRYYLLRADGRLWRRRAFKVGPPIGLISNRGAIGNIHGSGRDELLLPYSPNAICSASSGSTDSPRIFGLQKKARKLPGFPAVFPGTGSAQKGVTAAPILADVTGDSHLELLAGIENGSGTFLWVVSGNGTEVRRIGLGSLYLHSIAAAEDANGVIIVAVGVQGSGSKIIIHAKRANGGDLPGFPFTVGSYPIGGKQCFGSLNLSLARDPQDDDLIGFLVLGTGKLLRIDFNFGVTSLPWPQWQHDGGHSGNAGG